MGKSRGDAWLSPRAYFAGLRGCPSPLCPQNHGCGAPKDFGIKFLNLECEFLRHEMCSECGFLCLTQKQLWERPHFGTGHEDCHPHKHPGRSSVPTTYFTLSPRPNTSRAVTGPQTVQPPTLHPTRVGLPPSLPHGRSYTMANSASTVPRRSSYMPLASHSQHR
jgi:hypothetical protein